MTLRLRTREDSRVFANSVDDTLEAAEEGDK